MAEFMASSVAVHVTVVTGFVKVEPDDGVHTTLTDVSIRSEAVGSVHDTGFLDTKFAGHVIVGFAVSVVYQVKKQDYKLRESTGNSYNSN